MKILLQIILVSLLFISSSHSQLTNSRQKTYFKNKKFFISALDFQGEKNNQITLTTALRNLEKSLSQMSEFYVIDRAQRDRVFKEQKFESSENCDIDCAINIGYLLKADYVLLGEVKLNTINIQIINVKKDYMEVVNAESINGGVIQIFPMSKVANQIFRKISKFESQKTSINRPEISKKDVKKMYDIVSAKWMNDVYPKRISFLMGTDSLYKFLDKSSVSTINIETNKIYNSAKEKIIKFLQTKVIITKSKHIGAHFDEEKYLSDLLAMDNPTFAEAEDLKLAYITPKYETTKVSKNRIIKINKLSYQKVPNWSEIVNYAGGYSNVAKKGISKEDIRDFTLTEKLDSIEIVDDESCKAYFTIYGKNEAFDFYKQKEKNRFLFGKIIIPKINYSNLDEVDIEYNLGKGALKGRLITLSEKYQKQMKSTIDTMLDDLVSVDKLNNLLYKNPKTKKFSLQIYLSLGLKEMLSEGLITEEEYEAKTNKLFSL